MRRRTERSDCVALSTNFLHQDVVHLVILHLSGEIDTDLNPVLGILFLNGVQKRVEPFSSAEVTDDPDEVDFGKTSWLGVVEVVHAVPDRLEDAGKVGEFMIAHQTKLDLRGKGGNSDTSTNEQNSLKLRQRVSREQEELKTDVPSRSPRRQSRTGHQPSHEEGRG